MTVKEALGLARDRLVRDSDAYADEDLLGILVEAIEAEGLDAPPDVGQHLIRAARRCAAHAADAADASTSDGNAANAARVWADASRLALEGYRLAPVEPVEGDDAERAELGRMITGYREALGSASRFLVDLHATFASAGTPTAARVAGRIERQLAEMGVPIPKEGGAGAD